MAASISFLQLIARSIFQIVWLTLSIGNKALGACYSALIVRRSGLDVTGVAFYNSAISVPRQIHRKNTYAARQIRFLPYRLEQGL